MSVITCPGPGSGKTVLLRSWIGQAGAAGLSERVARVPAARGERDPQRFRLSVLAALRQTAPGVAAGAGGDGGAGPWTAGRSPSGCWRIWRRWMTRCGRWSMMHELGPLALRQLELLITRAPPELRFVPTTRHDVRRHADVQAEQDRRVAGIRLAEAAHSRPSHPHAKVCGQPPGRRHHRTPPYCAPDGSSR
jgi:LuxR family maltose regulon positive regulatory protein